MEFKTFKPHLKRTAIYCSIAIIILLIIGLDVFGAIAGKYPVKSDEAIKEIGRLIVVLADGIILLALVWVLNMSSSFTALAYVVTSKTYITKETKTTITKFTNPWWIHLMTALLLIVIYFLSITGMMVTKISWVSAIKNNWWITLIIFILNFAVLEFNYNWNLYSFNHDQKIISLI